MNDNVEYPENLNTSESETNSTTSDSSTSDDDSPNAPVSDNAIEEFAKEIMELVACGDIKEIALEKILKSFHSLLEKGGCGEKFRSVPASFYLAEKWAQKNSTPIHSVLLDICPNNDHYVYKHNSTETNCPLCGMKRSTDRQMMVGGVTQLVKMMYSNKNIAEVKCCT